ncbi:hypothetical protein HYW21_01910 [Candidatus Woesearchaeota archaeon]|nr:hypothetical protein [Candidatus Woesearchaeota archaeon]
MTWKTIYTDGKIFADAFFMEHYQHQSGYMNENCFAAAVQEAHGELYPSTIRATRVLKDQFRSYDLNVPSRGTSTLTLRTELDPVVRNVLGVPDGTSLEGVVVQAFGTTEQIFGFRALPKPTSK